MSVRHVNELLTDQTLQEGYLALDTNILIAVCDETHQFHGQTVSFLHKLVQAKNLQFAYFVASKIELGEYCRRRFLTLYLRDNYRNNFRFIGAGGSVDEYCRNHPKIQAPHEDHESLNDHEIKDIRHRCFHDFKDAAAGIQKWQQLSHMALAGQLQRGEERLASFKILYKSLYDTDLFPPGAPKPFWKDQEKFITSFSFSAADAAILNMAVSVDKIVGVMTNDIDFCEICRTSEIIDKVTCYTFSNRLLAKVS